ncbi:MAG TPA: hypothetical protein VFA28_16095, partial [Bryobacteraceae bacterium]|nr:hypothetical protein [Bryobacteraceae bacterium]
MARRCARVERGAVDGERRLGGAIQLVRSGASGQQVRRDWEVRRGVQKAPGNLVRPGGLKQAGFRAGSPDNAHPILALRHQERHLGAMVKPQGFQGPI